MRDALRAWFPSLASGFAYLENAGGSQVPGVVADAMRAHLLGDYVQLGANYPQSVRASAMVEAAHALTAEVMNAGDAGKVVLGPSTTALTHLIANAYGETLRPGDEFIIAETNHEANAGPWARLEMRGAQVRTWPMNRETFRCEPADLAPLLNERTRLVALPHASNIVGQVEDVRAVVEMAHVAGARVCADGVAYGPHRAIDVQELGVDWYVFSLYKVYGPHMAALYGTNEAFAELTGPNHDFIPKDSVPYKWELGGVNHEACAGWVALMPYLAFLAGHEAYQGRSTVEAAFARMAELELPLETRLREYLAGKSELTVIGPRAAGKNTLGTVSFIHATKPADQISDHVNAKGDIGIRHGHMYAMRLIDALGIPPEPGVVRASLVHYNTEEEIERLIGRLDEAL